MLDMAVQGDGGVLKVFPSVSERWADASIASLRTEGAFLVDADRAGGATRWIRIRSEAGEPLTLDHGISGAVDVRDEHGRPLSWHGTGPGRIAVRLPRGATAVVTPRGAHASRGPRDVPANGPAEPWGLPS